MLQDAGILNLSSYTTHVIQDRTLSFGSCFLVAPSRKVLELLNALCFYQCGPTLGAKVCHQYYSLLWFLLKYTLQLAAGAFRLLHPGGDSSYPWVSVRALGHNLGKDRTIT